VFREAEWIGAAPIGGGLVEVHLRVHEDTARSYRVPGQYTEIECTKGRAYFVLAHRVLPVRMTTPKLEWRFVVKPEGAVAEFLAFPPAPRTQLLVRDALGAGFALERAQDRRCIVMVAGSGFAAGHAVVWARIEASLERRTVLVVGVERLEDVPDREHLLELRAAGMRVVLCAPPSAGAISLEVLQSGFETYTGFADGWLRAQAASDGPVVVAAGPRGLIASLQQLASQDPNLVSSLLLNV
jgi:NAD(P)H-flavin reductase